MELDYNKIFKLTLTAMSINGSHPFKERNKKWFITFAFCILHIASFFSLFIYNIVVIDLKNGDFIKARASGVLCVICIVISFQIIVLIIKRKHIKNLINAVKKDYELTKGLPRSDQEVVLKYAMNGQRISKQWLFITLCISAIYPIRNFFYIYKSWKNGKFELEPMYDISFILNFIDNNSSNIFVYLGTSIYLNFLSFIATTSYIGFVPLGPSFLMHACGQLELVKRMIDTLFDSDDVGVIRYRLKCIVMQMQYIYSFVEQIEFAFMETYEMTLKLDAILIPVCLFETVECLQQGILSVEFLSFFFGGIIISFSPCYYSELLIEKGEEVKEAMYACGWEKLHDSGIRSTIQLFLLRSLRPIAIRTLFRTVCLDALADLSHQSYAIFNLIAASR